MRVITTENQMNVIMEMLKNFSGTCCILIDKLS